MTDLGHKVSNSRSPGTPVCHPDDAYQSHAFQATTSAVIGRRTAAITEENEYVELHCASAFSFLDGGSQPETLIERGAQLGMAALALADRNGLYGAARFHAAGVRCGVKAHIGAEIAVRTFGNMLTPPAWLPHRQRGRRQNH